MSMPIHPQLRLTLDLAEGLVFVTRALAKAASRQAPLRTGPRRGMTLRPGGRTPHWNALILAVRPHLTRYGEKSNLARELGVPPQRIHAYFKARTQSPDAERTLMLLTWLATRQPARSKA